MFTVQAHRLLGATRTATPCRAASSTTLGTTAALGSRSATDLHPTPSVARGGGTASRSGRGALATLLARLDDDSRRKVVRTSGLALETDAALTSLRNRKRSNDSFTGRLDGCELEECAGLGPNDLELLDGTKPLCQSIAHDLLINVLRDALHAE